MAPQPQRSCNLGGHITLGLSLGPFISISQNLKPLISFDPCMLGLVFYKLISGLNFRTTLLRSGDV